jgi:transposase
VPTYCVEKRRLIRRGSLILFSLVREIRPIMGERRVMQEALFYGFSLERHVPDNHMLRKIDRFVDLSDLRAHLGPYYSDVGRPSIDPELMRRMLIVGYCFDIRSERRLCEGGPPKSGYCFDDLSETWKA